MASSVDNVHVGGAKVTYKSTDLGWLDENGISIEMPGHTYVPLTVDEYGAYPLSKFDIGIESFKVKFNLYENLVANRTLLMPLATTLSVHTLTEGKAVGTEMTSLHGTLNIHPRENAVGNLSRDIDVHLCLLEWKGEFKHDVRGIQMLVVEGEAIIDTSKSATNLLFSVGGATS